MSTTQTFRLEITDALGRGVPASEIENVIQNVCHAGIVVSVIDKTESE